jgi:hypothetical protein
MDDQAWPLATLGETVEHNPRASWRRFGASRHLRLHAPVIAIIL